MSDFGLNCWYFRGDCMIYRCVNDRDVESFELLDEMVFIMDANNYETLFLNKAARRAYHIHEYRGHLCYKLLQNRTKPCDHCGPDNKSSRIKSWQYYNPVLKRFVKISDKLIYYHDRLARLQVGSDITQQERQRIELKNALDAEKTINEVVQILYSIQDFNLAASSILEKIGLLLSADRMYFCLFEHGKVFGIREWCNTGVISRSASGEFLEQATLDRWMPSFEKHQSVCVYDINYVTDQEQCIRMMRDRVYRYAAVPVMKKEKVIGLLCVDNPAADKLKNVRQLLLTLSTFISLILLVHEHEGFLTALSYTDLMTGVSNRNAFIRATTMQVVGDVSIGVVFFDINGLKQMNDTKGHQAGDQAIILLAKILTRFFSISNIYRTGGDEFVVLCKGLTLQEFMEKVQRVTDYLKVDTELSVSIGKQWAANHKNLEQVVSKADEDMYLQKKEYYRRKQLDEC